MIIKILVWLIISLLCAVLYRLGGVGKPFDTKYRDLGVPALCLPYLWFLGHSHLLGPFWLQIALFLGVFGLMFWALTTYWDFLFGFDNYWFHGFAVAVACVPLYFLGFHWWAIVIRCVILAVLVGGWSAWIKLDWLEEGGRGFFIAATIPLLLL